MPIHLMHSCALRLLLVLIGTSLYLLAPTSHVLAAPGGMIPPDVSQEPATVTPVARTPLETFEGAQGTWAVQAETTGSGIVQQSTMYAAAGAAAARTSTSGSGQVAQVRVAFSEAASSHAWAERPGTWRWQQASLYIPSSTIAQLGAGEYLTIAGLWPSASSGYGWWLRIRQNGALYVYGYDADGAAREFNIYATAPIDRWFELEIGLHSQNGPGVKRAFAFLIDGNFYGWYHQGRMASETYSRAAFGILGGNSPDAVELYVDNWQVMTSGPLPAGPDLRSSGSVQVHDFRTIERCAMADRLVNLG